MSRKNTVVLLMVNICHPITLLITDSRWCTVHLPSHLSFAVRWQSSSSIIEVDNQPMLLCHRPEQVWDPAKSLQKHWTERMDDSGAARFMFVMAYLRSQTGFIPYSNGILLPTSHSYGGQPGVCASSCECGDVGHFTFVSNEAPVQNNL